MREWSRSGSHEVIVGIVIVGIVIVGIGYRYGYACRHGPGENSIFKMKAAYRHNQWQIRFSCFLVVDCLSSTTSLVFITYSLNNNSK